MATRAVVEVQFKENDSEKEFWRKLRQLAQLVSDLARQRSGGGTNTTVVETVLPTMGSPRILGRETGAGQPNELTPNQVNNMLPIFTPGVGGLVPPPGPPTALRFLRDDGSWQMISFDLGSIQHSTLAGLGNDDHPQYLLRADARPIMYTFLGLGA